jgi:NADPH:quinone reductase-like Zn-dependent oxidoreductase
VEIGGAGTIEQSMRASRLGGHISLIGVLAGYAGSINTALLMSMQIRLIGITVGARQHQQDMIRAIEANGIKPVLDQSFPLTMLAEAFRRQESGQHFGKIIVEW